MRDIFFVSYICKYILFQNKQKYRYKNNATPLSKFTFANKEKSYEIACIFFASFPCPVHSLTLKFKMPYCARSAQIKK